MPFIPHTPESVFARSDSKNPAATCRGLTASGRPCRRALANDSSSAKSPGIVASLPLDEALEKSLCWQHRDQAERLSQTQEQALNNVLKERSSIDTLAERLGLSNLRSDTFPQRRPKHHGKQAFRPASNSTLPNGQIPASGRHSESSRKRSTVPSLLSIICCMTPVDKLDHTELESAKPPRMSSQTVEQNDRYRLGVPQEVRVVRSRSAAPGGPFLSQDDPPRSRIGQGSPGSSLPYYRLPQSEGFLGQIDRTVSSANSSLLLAELAKPISPMDEEGYIYMFWLSDAESTPTPSAKTASSLLAPPRPSDPKDRQTQARSLLDATTVGNDITGGTQQSKRTILVKIGRASNVHRRMNEWNRQCGFDLSLIRYYPYVPSSSSPAPSPGRASSPRAAPASPNTPRKVPHVHRVERLIHIELADSRVKKACRECGKEHREWFSLEASREGIRAVDAVIRRWVEWAERSSEI